MQVSRLQQDMKALGLYDGLVDGIWGSMSETGYLALLEAARARNEVEVSEQPSGQGMAWGKRVSPVFRDRIRWTADALGTRTDWLMACIAFESGETFRADVRNAAGSGATGLIQFMPDTARALGTSTDALAMMSAEDQINYVYRYFKPYRGRLQNLGDVYMAILWPAGIGQASNWVMWDRNRRPTTYRQNSGLDANRDGVITRGEAVAKIEAKLSAGLLPANFG